MIAKAVYLLCALTSMACAGLLIRAHQRKGTRLLLWSMVGFLGLSVSNMLLFADLVLYPELDLRLWRGATALLGLASLITGLIWDTL